MKSFLKTFLISSAIGIFLFSLTSGCKKTDINPVPYVFTDIYLYTANPSFVNLNAVGGFAYIDGGVRGIIVYRRSNEEFVAFDRNCSYDPDKICATIKINSTNITAVDSCCSSSFNIYDGSVIKGPATRGLRQYNTYFNGSSLHITN